MAEQVPPHRTVLADRVPHHQLAELGGAPRACECSRPLAGRDGAGLAGTGIFKPEISGNRILADDRAVVGQYAIARHYGTPFVWFSENPGLENWLPSMTR